MSSHVAQRSSRPLVRVVPWTRLRSLRVGLVLWGGLAAADLSRIAALPSYAGLAAVALVVMVAAAGVPTSTAFTNALVGWLVVNGFVVHRFGELRIEALSDLGRLLLLTGLATGAARACR